MNTYLVLSYNMHNERRPEWSEEVEADSAIEAICKAHGLVGHVSWTSRSGPALREGENEDNAHWQRNPARGTVGAFAMRIVAPTPA